MNRVNCPCCGFPTLEARNDDEICRMCSWQDDGQDDPRADVVWGGPNADYSLSEADDAEFVQHLLFRYSKHPNEQIRGAAVRSFGHLARIQGPVNRALVLPAIEKVLADESPSVRAQAQSALADLSSF